MVQLTPYDILSGKMTSGRTKDKSFSFIGYLAK
jgi:hypothetical protein